MNTCLPHVAKKYAASLEANILHHRLIQKLGEAHSLGTSKGSTCCRINRVDEEGVQYMTHTEHHCQKLKSGRICFSPESVIWIKQEQIYCLLVEYKLGRHKNRGNLKQAAHIQKIKDPFLISLAQLKILLEVCAERNNYFQQNSKQYCKKHLLQWAGIVKDKGREEVAAQILAIIKCKQDGLFWQQLNYTCRKTKAGSLTLVQVLGTNDLVVEHITQPSVQEVIWLNIHYKCLYLAEEAPVCWGRLHKELGYNAVLDTAHSILAGTYVYPEDFNEATKELCQECALIKQIVPQDSVGIKITKKDHQAHRKNPKEETLLSKSGLHFGHHMAGSLLEYINHFHALKATLLLQHGLVLERWAQGLSVVLQKMWVLAHHQALSYSTDEGGF